MDLDDMIKSVAFLGIILAILIPLIMTIMIWVNVYRILPLGIEALHKYIGG